MLTAPQLSAGVAAICLIASIAWLASADYPVVNPGKPTTKASPVLILEAAVPAIGDFSQFNVNDVNPFVPFNLRGIESETIKRPPSKTGVKPQPKGPTVEVEKIVLPKLGGPLANGPKVTGVLLSHDSQQVFLTYPGDSKPSTLKPGDSVRGWTLVEVIGTNVVRMKDDATGTVHDLVIAETPNQAKPKKTDDKKDDKKTDQGDVGKKSGTSKAPEQKSAPPPVEKRPEGHKHGDHKNGGEVPGAAPVQPPVPVPAPAPTAPAQQEKML